MEPVRVLAIAQLTFPVGWTLPAHAHRGSHELVLVIAGAIETTIAGQALVAGPGVLKHHPADVPHAERAMGQAAPTLCWLTWSGPAVAIPRQVEDRDGRLQALMAWMRGLDLADAAQQGLARAQLATLLAAMAVPAAGSADHLLRTVRDHVRSHLADRLSLEGLARQARLSPFHFARRFRLAAGCSPMAFVRRERIAAATRLLATTPLPLRAIAPMVGLGDEFHLARVLKRETGSTAGDLRRRG